MTNQVQQRTQLCCKSISSSQLWSWISLSLLLYYICVSVWERGKKKKKKREISVCVCVCLNAYPHCGQASGQGTSSLGPGCWGRERMRRMVRQQRWCVFTEWHSSYSPRSSLCSSDLWTHTNVIIKTNTDPTQYPAKQTVCGAEMWLN